MLILASTSDIIRVVTGSAANIAANASYVDNASGTITPGRTDTAAITTATTTTVVGSPGSSTQRTVEMMTLRNTSNSTATTIVVQHYDGSTSTDLTPTMTLQPGEALALDDHGRWKHVLSAGAQLLADRTPVKRPVHSSWLAETYPRELLAEAAASLVVSTAAYATAIVLKAGTTVSNISLHTGSVAATSPSHFQYGLYTAEGGLLAASADQTTSAINANTLYTLAMSTPYIVPRSGIYYVAVTVTASTTPSFRYYLPVATNMRAAGNAAFPLLACGGLVTNSGILAGQFYSSLAGGSGSPFWAAVS